MIYIWFKYAQQIRKKWKKEEKCARFIFQAKFIKNWQQKLERII